MSAPRPSQAEKPIRGFDSARKAFLSSLSPQDRVLYGPCESEDELFQFTEKLQVMVAAKLGSSRIVGVVKNIHDAFEPYFQVIGIFVSSKPDVAALVWGSVHLVLRVRY